MSKNESIQSLQRLTHEGIAHQIVQDLCMPGTTEQGAKEVVRKKIEADRRYYDYLLERVFLDHIMQSLRGGGGALEILGANKSLTPATIMDSYNSDQISRETTLESGHRMRVYSDEFLALERVVRLGLYLLKGPAFDEARGESELLKNFSRKGDCVRKWEGSHIFHDFDADIRQFKKTVTDDGITRGAKFYRHCKWYAFNTQRTRFVRLPSSPALALTA